MGKKSDIRVRIDLAREAYRISGNPDISPIYQMSVRWGADPEPYSNPEEIYLTHVRSVLFQRGIDYKIIITKFLKEIADHHGTKRAQRIVEWLQPGGTARIYSHWHQLELKHDIRELNKLLRIYERNPA